MNIPFTSYKYLNISGCCLVETIPPPSSSVAPKKKKLTSKIFWNITPLIMGNAYVALERETSSKTWHCHSSILFFIYKCIHPFLIYDDLGYDQRMFFQKLLGFIHESQCFYFNKVGFHAIQDFKPFQIVLLVTNISAALKSSSISILIAIGFVFNFS